MPDAAMAFGTWQAYTEQLAAQREKLQDVCAMFEATQTSQLLHSVLAGWRGVVVAHKQAESSAVILSERRYHR